MQRAALVNATIDPEIENEISVRRPVSVSGLLEGLCYNWHWNWFVRTSMLARYVLSCVHDVVWLWYVAKAICIYSSPATEERLRDERFPAIAKLKC